MKIYKLTLNMSRKNLLGTFSTQAGLGLTSARKVTTLPNPSNVWQSNFFSNITNLRTSEGTPNHPER